MILICRRVSAILECATLINSQEIHTVELTEDERAAWDTIPDGRTLCPDCFDDRVKIARLRRLRDGAWTRFCALPRYVNGKPNREGEPILKEVLELEFRMQALGVADPEGGRQEHEGS